MKTHKSDIQEALRGALQNLNAVSQFVDELPEDYSPMESLFEHDIPTASEVYAKLKTPKLTDEEYKELSDYFHNNIGKSGRSLNHNLNKVKMDWRMKNLRTPPGYRALVEVAKDHGLHPVDMCEAIQVNDRFADGPIGAAANELLALEDERNGE